MANHVTGTGGAIHGRNPYVLRNRVFRANRSTCTNAQGAGVGWAGAIGTFGGSDLLEVHDSLFEGNSASQLGGAVSLRHKGLFRGCTFLGNSTGSGAGGAVHLNIGSADQPADFVNCTFFGNVAGTAAAGSGRRGAFRA